MGEGFRIKVAGCYDLGKMLVETAEEVFDAMNNDVAVCRFVRPAQNDQCHCHERGFG